MNIITIQDVNDLREIFTESICFSGNVDDEVDQNMWAIMLAHDCSLRHITVQKLENFFDELIQVKEQQLANRQATLYVWFDELALQLCFNILSGVVNKLPFGCRLKEVPALSSIIQAFLDSFQNPPLSYDKMTFFEPGDDDFDDDAYEEEIKKNFILDVYIKFLNKSAD